MARKPRRRSATACSSKRTNQRTRESLAERWRVGFIDATDEGAGFVIGVAGPIAEQPSYGMWEYWSKDANGVASPTYVPVRWRPGEAWALINRQWQEVNSSQVGNEARMLDKESYESFFGATLIALPAVAFPTQRD